MIGKRDVGGSQLFSERRKEFIEARGLYQLMGQRLGEDRECCSCIHTFGFCFGWILARGRKSFKGKDCGQLLPLKLARFLNYDFHGDNSTGGTGTFLGSYPKIFSKSYSQWHLPVFWLFGGF